VTRTHGRSDDPTTAPNDNNSALLRIKITTEKLTNINKRECHGAGRYPASRATTPPEDYYWGTQMKDSQLAK
jgi:hypothetical protein